MLEFFKNRTRAQIALEFIIVYSFVLLIFALIFVLVASQRALTLTQQEYSLLQLQAQNIADHIDQAVSAGTGYSTYIPLVEIISSNPYNLTISTSGVVIAKMKVGGQIISAYAFSNARNLSINGTLTQSANGISLYVLPTYTGRIFVSNLNGVIYVNQKPVSTFNQSSSLFVKQAENLKVAAFTGQAGSYIQTLCVNANLCSSQTFLTISIWFNYNASTGTQFWVPFDSNPEGVWRIGINSIGNTIMFDPGIATNVYTSANVVPGAWYNFIMSLQKSGSTVAYNAFLNGTLIASNSLSPASITAVTSLLFGSNVLGTYLFSGKVSNIQLYNVTFSQQQALQMYQNGLAGQPLITTSNANLLGWWPLNGNPNDYTGFGDTGIPHNMRYQTVVQLNTHVSGANGADIFNTIVGFISSKGSFSRYGNGVSLLTDINGNQTAYLTSNGAIGTANVTVLAFNGNLSTMKNLAAWWPLTFGFGSNVFDLANYNNAVYNSPKWVNMSPGLPSFIAARFPPNPVPVASGSDTGYITINSAYPSLSNIATNDSLTIMAWIYYRGPTPTHSQIIFGDGTSVPSGGFDFLGYDLAGSDLFGIGGVFSSNKVPWPSGLTSFPKNNWEMVVAEYNGTTGQANVYLNNSLFASNVLAPGLSLTSTVPFKISAYVFGGIASFNGIISNVQLYSKFLTQQQINNLYKAGITSVPLSDSGLVGWWPLTGNPNDYSINANNGVVNYNVSFINTQFTKPLSNQSVASFNGPTTNVLQTSPFPWAADPTTSKFAVSLWVHPNSGSGVILSEKAPLGVHSSMIELVSGHVYINSLYTPQCLDLGIIPINSWTNIVLTYNSLTYNGYINGVFAKNIDRNVGVPVTNPPSFPLGDPDSVNCGSGVGYSGLIADYQFYNSILTPQQVQQLYQAGMPQQKRIYVSLGNFIS